MSKIKKRILQFFGVMTVFLFSLSTFQLTSSAKEIATTEEVTKVVSEEKLSNLISPLSTEKNSTGEVTVLVSDEEGQGQESSIKPLGVDTAKILNLGVGKSWSDSFKMNNLFGQNHNAFNVKVSSVTSGYYKIIITGTNGYEYTSKELYGGGTVTTTNANINVTYTVTIVNTSSTTLNAVASITSYVN